MPPLLKNIVQGAGKVVQDAGSTGGNAVSTVVPGAVGDAAGNAVSTITSSTAQGASQAVDGLPSSLGGGNSRESGRAGFLGGVLTGAGTILDGTRTSVGNVVEAVPVVGEPVASLPVVQRTLGTDGDRRTPAQLTSPSQPTANTVTAATPSVGNDSSNSPQQGDTTPTAVPSAAADTNGDGDRESSGSNAPAVSGVPSGTSLFNSLLPEAKDDFATTTTGTHHRNDRPIIASLPPLFGTTFTDTLGATLPNGQTVAAAAYPYIFIALGGLIGVALMIAAAMYHRRRRSGHRQRRLEPFDSTKFKPSETMYVNVGEIEKQLAVEEQFEELIHDPLKRQVTLKRSVSKPSFSLSGIDEVIEEEPEPMCDDMDIHGIV